MYREWSAANMPPIRRSRRTYNALRHHSERYDRHFYASFLARMLHDSGIGIQQHTCHRGAINEEGIGATGR